MYHVTSQLQFDHRGNCYQVSLELRHPETRERLSLVVAPVGPFEDFSEVYAQAYQRAVNACELELPGFLQGDPRDHPLVSLRRATDPQEAHHGGEQLAVGSSGSALEVRDD